jgi:transmembrane sensor
LYASTIAEDLEQREENIPSVVAAGETRSRKIFSGRLSGTQTLRGWLLGATIAGIVAVVFTAHRRTSNVSQEARVYTTNASQQVIITLTDGTQVTLGPSTTLHLTRFDARVRDVVLDAGEAYFRVRSASLAPFTVHSGAVMTQVLGTEFLVRRDMNGARIHVAVADGKVRVTRTAQSDRPDTVVALTAGEISDITDSTIHVSQIHEIARGTEWMPGQLVFHHTAVATILHTLSRWYGYQFRYADPTLAERPVTMGISTESSTDALAAIERVLDVNLTIVGDTVTLVPEPMVPARRALPVRTYDLWMPTREVGR